MSLAETYANNAETTLSSPISAGDGTLSVSSATGFPSVGQFRVLIESEIVLVTGVSGTTFTVERGQEGTTAASHSAGSKIDQIITRDGLIGVCGSHILSDSYSLLPVSGVVGQLFFPSDGNVLLRDDGTVWRGFGPLYPLTPPKFSDFSWVNQGSASGAQSGSSVFISSASAGGASVRARVKAAPSTPYSVVALIRANLGPTAFNQYGVGWRDSGTGKIVTMSYVWNNGSPIWQCNKWDSATSFNAAYTLSGTNGSARQLDASAGFFFKIADDGTNRTCGYSLDGQNFRTIHSVGRTDFITPDQVLHMIEPEADFIDLSLLSWQES
jgi:hypothetical protein